MERKQAQFLKNWLSSESQKPLVIRGARQVGKTWLVRDFAKSQNLELVEINFEKRPELESLFQSNDPEEILLNLRSSTNATLKPSKSLLFLDEIQASPKILAKLRWFAEDMPELPVIAAGSLLEFTLAEHTFSMPVGRISYLHLEPFSFEEFLIGIGEQNLRNYLEKYTLDTKIPEAIHNQLIKAVKEYAIIGGMPAAISKWLKTKSLDQVSQAQFNLLATYRDDFAKYNGRLSVNRLEEVMAAIPRQLGEKFVYTKANPGTSSIPLKQGFDLLTKARVCYPAISTAANGLPLGAETNEKYKKAFLLDCGLCSASLGLNLTQLQSPTDLTLINSGGLAEQLVGQQLRTILPPYATPSLYYWQRTKSGASAEIDYIIQHENQIIPIEVKAGSTGTLKSLHQFMKEKQKTFAVRINSDYPSITPVQVKDASGNLIEYTLLSLPFYLTCQLHRLIN